METVRSHQGFTLFELLIALLLSAVLLMGTIQLLTGFQKEYPIEQQTTAMRQNLRLAMDTITRELRDAGNDPNGVNLTGIAIDPNGDGINNDIRIQKDVNPPDDFAGGGLTDPFEDITISFDSAQKVILLRDNVVSPAVASPIADENINNLTFTLLKLDGTVTTVAGQATAVRVRIDGRTKIKDPKSGNYLSETLTSDVRLLRR